MLTRNILYRIWINLAQKNLQITKPRNPRNRGALVAYSSKRGQLGRPKIEPFKNGMRIVNREQIAIITAPDTNTHY